jgi:hypothetical protein
VAKRLIAKLAPPRQGRIHPRPRLFRHLDCALRGAAVWVSGPPGAGKTALVASWVSRLRGTVMWLQVDAGDGDPAELFEWLAAAAPARVRRKLPRFGPAYSPDPVAFARRFARALRGAAGELTLLVLDDYSELPAGAHAIVRELLRELAGAVGVVVTSRAPPPALLSPFRAAGGLEVLDPAALALTAREAAAVARVRGATAPSGDDLVQLTGGWAAGVVLVAASGGRADAAHTPQEVFDFLATEVFDRAPRHVQELLLRVALPRRIGAASAQRLARDPRAGDVLEDLAARGWFVLRHRGADPGYQLHPLLRAFLLARSRRVLGDAAFRELLLESARVSEEEGDASGAVALYREAGALDELGRVIATSAPELLAKGAARTVLDWTALLPDAVVDASPWHLHWRGAARTFVMPGNALADAERAYELFKEAGDAAGAYVAWSGAVRAVMFGVQDDHAALDRWLDELGRVRAAFPAWPAPQIEALVVATVLPAFALRRPGDLSIAAWEERALAIALAPGDPRVRLDVGTPLLIRDAVAACNLRRAAVVMRTLRPLLAAGQCAPVDELIWAAWESYAWLNAGEAGRGAAAAVRGLEVAELHGLPHWDATLLTAQMLGEAMLDRLDRAGACVTRLAREVGAAPRLPQVAYHSAACIFRIRSGDPRTAIEHGRIAVALAEQTGSVIPGILARVSLAIALERTGLPALEEALVATRATGVALGEHGALLAIALAALERGEEPRAADAVAEAFALGERTGIRGSSWLTRAELAELCAFALERGIAAASALDTIQTCALSPGPRARGLRDWPWAIRVDALGGFAVGIEGRAPPDGKAQKKPLELLRLLVAHGERGASLERLAEALWPDADGDTSLHALETTLYRLRRLLADPASVVRRGGRAALEPGHVFVDAWAFEALASRGEALRARGDLAGALRAAASARELYQGELLADHDHPALEPARARLRRRFEALRATRA